MSDLFKSAFEYFSGPAYGQQSDNNFVGQTVEISNVKLRIKKVLAEGNFFLYWFLTEFFQFVAILGGFAVVFIAQDINTGKDYALKVRS